MKKVLIYFGNLESLHPDEIDTVDAGLIGIGTYTNNKFLVWKGTYKADGTREYEFGTRTTVEWVEQELRRIANVYPELNIIHTFVNQ